jgi:GTP pyrophosphokinase
MSRITEIINRIKQYNPRGNFAVIEKAYQFSQKAHQGQLRNSGEPYIIHPLAVAEILAELELDISTIVAAILHDVLEDTRVTFEELVKEFGEEVAVLVDGVTKLSRIEYKSKEDQQAENMRKMFLAMAKDIRVILIKLADRLHNMRTLKYLTVEKQKEKAQETLEIFAPLAHRLGIYRIKWELEDLSLRYIDQEMYYYLVDKVAKKRKEREEYIQNAIDAIDRKLQEVNIQAKIEGRPKHFYSIYEKIKKKGKNFSEIYDLIGIRVLVESVKDCYGALGIIHTIWKPLPGRFKDYIAMPKPNMYQSLHTTVIGPLGDPLEIQIRTFDMHRTAEHGIAAHWKYKEGGNSNPEFEKKLSWLRQLLEIEDEARDAREFMEGLKIDLFSDEVFVFTPKGDVIDLPAGSIPLDFAYRIHTDVGNRCIGAKVNGKIVTLDYQLRNGDIVEILTSKTANGPSRDWLKIVKTSQAKNKIRQWFKRNSKEENVSRGREILEKELRRGSLDNIDIDKNELLQKIAIRLNFNSTEEMFAALGHGGISVHPIINKWNEEIKKKSALDKDAESLLWVNKRAKRKKDKNGVRVKGINDVYVRFSKCCNPVPGDDIIGYITRGRGISVHRADCPNANQFVDSQDRLIEVSWDNENEGLYHVKLLVEALDKPGVLSEIISAIAENQINISAIDARPLRNRQTVINLVIEVRNKEQVEKVLKRLRNVNNVHNVERAVSTHK